MHQIIFTLWDVLDTATQIAIFVALIRIGTALKGTLQTYELKDF